MSPEEFKYMWRKTIEHIEVEMGSGVVPVLQWCPPGMTFQTIWLTVSPYIIYVIMYFPYLTQVKWSRKHPASALATFTFHPFHRYR